MKLYRVITLALALAFGSSSAFGQASPGTSPLTIAKGGTAASTASGARTSLGVPTGTSGHALGFLDAANTWSGLQTYSATGVAFSVLSSGATANAYSNWQNGTRQWIVGVGADSACASGTATAFIFYDQTAVACRAWLSTDGGWIFGSSTTSPGAGNINLTGGAVWNNGTAPTGTGAYVRATSPALVTPALGTPSAAVLTNATGLPVSTGISGLATSIASWLATSSSANLATAVTDETGSGSLVFATSPTLVTPVLGVASATSINKLTITSPATSATLTVPDGVTLTGPASSGTAMTLGNTETVTGVKTFGSSGAVGRLKIAGTTSGSTVLDATAAASGTLTLPAATDTLVGKATTDTLTNKTFDTAGTGNSFSINSLAATTNTGTGAVVRATSPTLVTPVLGTPASGTATNLTGLPLTTGVTGTLPLGSGGTGQTTAPLARASSGLNVDSFTGHGDSIYTILTTDRTVGTNAAFTASRTWTLPAANAVNPGQEIIVADFQGTVTGSNTLVISRAGSDTVNGGTSVTITAANGAYLLKSDGTSKWTAQALGAAAAGGVSSVTCGTGLSGGVITTSGTCAVSLSTLTNSIGADVLLNNTANYFDGPSVAQGTSGTWVANGNVTAMDTAIAAIYCKLWDGTTVISSAWATVAIAGAGVVVSLSGAITSPAGNIRISCRDFSTANGKMMFNQTGNSKDSTITVFRIQ